MHKYTREIGDNQGSQFHEMIKLMSRFTQCKNREVVVLIIVDDPYYEMNKQETT